MVVYPIILLARGITSLVEVVKAFAFPVKKRLLLLDPRFVL